MPALVDAVARPHAVKRLMGVMPQEATLYWGLSVRHHLRIFARLRGLRRRDAARRCEELIADLGLQEHRDKSTETLSGGLRRRVLLGIATVADSPLLILDEPSVGLDPEARRDLWELLRSYRQRGKTVLLSTHYLEEAEALCSRVGIIQQGSLRALDTVENLYSAYQVGNLITAMLSLVLAAVSPVYFTMEQAPLLLKLLGYISPLRYAADGITKSLSGQVDVWFELAVLAGFALVTMTLGTWRLPWRED